MKPDPQGRQALGFGFPWLDHLTWGEVEEYRRLFERYLRGELGLEETDRLRALRRRAVPAVAA